MVVILVNCGFMASNIEVPNSEYVQFCAFFCAFNISCKIHVLLVSLLFMLDAVESVRSAMLWQFCSSDRLSVFRTHRSFYTLWDMPIIIIFVGYSRFINYEIIAFIALHISDDVHAYRHKWP